MKTKIFGNKICKNCNNEFALKNNQKREKNRLFCNHFCSSQYNGKNNLGRKHSSESKAKIKLALLGENNPFFGKKHNDDTKKLLSEQRKGISWDEKFGTDKATQLKKEFSDMFSGEKNPFFGKIHTNESRDLIKKSHRDQFGENNPNWQGGVSFDDYSPEFNKKLKLKIRTRDNFICFICKELGLDVHHIDYNKMNSDENNLITLCQSCHSKTNFNREYWLFFFKGVASDK